MRTILIIALALVLIYIAYAGVKFYAGVQAARRGAALTKPHEKQSTDHALPVLVLGDSTAVGVGAATPEESLAGLVSGYLHATSVENYAVSGAEVKDLRSQVAEAKLAHYRLILIQIGGNDIIAFHDASTTAALLAQILKTLPGADRVVVISAGNVGGATLFPWPIRPYYTYLNNQYHAAFAAVVAAAGMAYVNLAADPGAKLIQDQPDIYLHDGLHPSSAGYALWFSAIKPEL